MANIRQLKSGKWNVQVRKKGHELTDTFLLKSDAERWARQTEVEIDRGIFQNRTEAETTTLAQVCDRFEKEIAIKFKSFTTDRSRIANIKAHKISKVFLINLNSSELAKFRDDRVKDGMSDTSVNHELTLISRVLKACIIEWSIYLPQGIPLVKKLKKIEGRSRRVSDAEIEALVSASESTALKSIILFAVETAMRRSEIAELNFKNVNFATRTAKLEDTKNGTSRIVPLSTNAINILKSLTRNINSNVFNLVSSSITQAFERARDRALASYLKNCEAENVEVDERFLTDLRFHDLRHEATSRIAKKIPNIIELAAITGHKDVQMLKRYYHVEPSELATKLG